MVPTLERYDVRQIVQTKEPQKPSAAYLKWRDLIAQKRVVVLPAQSGLQIALDQNVALEFLSPPDDASAAPAIARLQVGNFGLLFAESAGTEEQAALRASDQAASALLVAPRKVSVEFIDAVNPQYAVIFSGKGARDKPSADLLAALSRATILRTDERGTLEFILDGQTLVVRTTR
ncbi:MAG: hypothetical protein HY239_03750 [Mycolicibacterium aromaticivorans]|nr:hypothetical protein [Mycolicibacterium aromaticivorans]